MECGRSLCGRCGRIGCSDRPVTDDESLCTVAVDPMGSPTAGWCWRCSWRRRECGTCWTAEPVDCGFGMDGTAAVGELAVMAA